MRFVVFAFLTLLATDAASAQSLTGNAPTPAPSGTGIRQQGIYLTAPVTLDGQTLFTIAAPILPQPGQTPIVQRQLAIENALTQLVTQVYTQTGSLTVYSPYTLRVERVPVDGQFVIEASDARHSTPVSILTVTPIDAKFQVTTTASLAVKWQAILHTALRTALLKRQPAIVEHHEREATIAGIALIALTIVVWLLLLLPLARRIERIERRIKQRGAQLEQAQAAPSADQSTTHDRRRSFLALALRVSDPMRQASVYRSISAALVWILVLIWFGALVWGFSLFPQTTPLARQVVRTVLAVAGIWIGAGLLNRILDVLIARLGQVWRERHYPTSEERARALLRIPTITSAMAGSKAFALFFIALLVTLSELNVPIWSVVTFGGLTAIGITLAAQNFVRDFVNGFLVLFEDQYVVGDYITINAQSGIVENLTLRMVQIRDMAGNLITVPHSSVTSVVNHSRNWSRVDYRVPVDPSADIAKALSLVREGICEVAREERWHTVVLDPVEWIGVDGLSRDGVVIRASMKTAPLRQFELRRAINERVQQRFREAGIALGAPVPEVLY
jgi:small conductance mechanosensitive channel